MIDFAAARSALAPYQARVAADAGVTTEEDTGRFAVEAGCVDARVDAARRRTLRILQPPVSGAVRRSGGSSRWAPTQYYGADQQCGGPHKSQTTPAPGRSSGLRITSNDRACRTLAAGSGGTTEFSVSASEE